MKYLLILLLIVSCGTRKTYNKSTLFKSDSISVNNTRILTQNSKLNNIYTIEPFDNSKPIIIDGKKYFNVTIKYDKSKFNNFEIKENAKIIKIKKENKTENKITEKKDNSNLWIGIIFVIVIGLVIYFKKI